VPWFHPSPPTFCRIWLWIFLPSNLQALSKRHKMNRDTTIAITMATSFITTITNLIALVMTTMVHTITSS
jgi:hypothetical protein